MSDLLLVLIVLLILVVLIRGPKTIPQIGSMLGRGVKEARREAADLRKERDGDAAPAAGTPPPPMPGSPPTTPPSNPPG